MYHKNKGRDLPQNFKFGGLMKFKSIYSTNLFNLQLFADGGASAGASSGGGAEGGMESGSGENSLDALGIPAKAKHIVDKMPKNKLQTSIETNTQNTNFETPINGTERKAFKDIFEEYGDEAKDYMNKAFSKRLSKYKNLEAENAKMREILDTQNIRYGLDANSETYLDDYKNAVQNDTKLFEEKALEAGLPVEEYIKVQNAERIIQENNKREQMRQQDEFAQGHVRNLIKQAESLKSEFPAFNLENEIANPQFKRLVDPPELGGVGLSVKNAFFALHNGEIMKATMNNAVNQAVVNTANAVQTNKARPPEGGLSHSHTVTVKENPANYKLEDFKRIRDEFRRTGVRPTF